MPTPLTNVGFPLFLEPVDFSAFIHASRASMKVVIRVAGV